ncbi:hypothetical protein [Nitrososphaera sp.]|uniref:hypothetical protein n=1 Tax=Nitrososphaera sp. TaxID=1971748 RepID=UPI00307E9041
MACRGICERYRATTGTSRYANGQRRCQVCDIFMAVKGTACPCCGYRLRTRPRDGRYKAKLRKAQGALAAEAKLLALSRAIGGG